MKTTRQPFPPLPLGVQWEEKTPPAPPPALPPPPPSGGKERPQAKHSPFPPPKKQKNGGGNLLPRGRGGGGGGPPSLRPTGGESCFGLEIGVVGGWKWIQPIHNCMWYCALNRGKKKRKRESAVCWPGFIGGSCLTTVLTSPSISMEKKGKEKKDLLQTESA